MTPTPSQMKKLEKARQPFLRHAKHFRGRPLRILKCQYRNCYIIFQLVSGVLSPCPCSLSNGQWQNTCRQRFFLVQTQKTAERNVIKKVPRLKKVGLMPTANTAINTRVQIKFNWTSCNNLFAHGEAHSADFVIHCTDERTKG